MVVRLAGRRDAVVTRCTHTAYIAVIKASVRLQLNKTGGIVTVITFGLGRCMPIGFSYGHNPVMAFAAFTHHFHVIYVG